MEDSGSVERLRQERDFYRQLLELGTCDEIEPFLEEALSLIARLSGARKGYLELQDNRVEGEAPRFWIAYGCRDSEIETVRKAFSRGIISEAIATGRTITTDSAMSDPRFGSRHSVMANQTEAVLCAPIGAGPPLGVVYLDRSGPGAFSEDDRRRAEDFARHAAAFVDRLLVRRRQRDHSDPTLPLRKAIRVEDVFGSSEALAAVLKQVSLVGPLDVSVLLTGPSGTGKTQLARIIHKNSPRASRPFIEINCAALPEALVESELFGAAPGAHSTAHKWVPGKVGAAEGGTLFLDEIGDLNLNAQAKLLQLLQSKEYYPLGSAKAVRSDTRILAATNQDLRAQVAKKAFREDLLYRLEVVPIRMPSLAERREDIPLLCERFCAHACEKHRFDPVRLSSGALRAAAAAEWPGNVRELEYKIEAAVIRAIGERSPQVQAHHVFSATAGQLDAAQLTFQEATRQFQLDLLARTLKELDWNVGEVARRLDLSRSHVYNLISAFALERSPR